MHYSYLEDPSRAYARVLVLISMASGYLGWDNSLINIHKVIILYQRADLSIKYNILLYYLLIIFTQVLKAPSRSIPIREVFSLGLKDLIRLYNGTGLVIVGTS